MLICGNCELVSYLLTSFFFMMPLSSSTIQRVHKKAGKEHTFLRFLESEMASSYLCLFQKMVWISSLAKLAPGTGHIEPITIYNLIESWKLTDKIQALSFDTAPVNTGHLNGVCILLKRKIGRELLCLVCCHHVMEMIVAKIFTLCCGSNSLYILIFKRFKAAWGGVM